MEIELKKKSKVNKTLLLILPVFLVLALGISYAFFTYTKTSDKSSQLITGDIYMHYNESNELTIENAIPSATYDENKYFEFTINGKNTYTKEDIWYEIVLSHGEKHATRTERIRDDLLKFTLVEIKDGKEKVVVNGKSYEDLTNQRIWVNTIPKTTYNEINITYRLYMWISDEILVGVGENIDYSMDTWNNLLYGSVKVSVNGDFEEKEVPLTASGTLQKVIDDKIISNPSCKTYVEEDGIIYLSGTKECIDFNYVWYSGKLWRITAIYPDGTMKLITDGVISAIKWGENGVYSTSYIREWLNQEFLPTLYNYQNIIVENAGWYSVAYAGVSSPPEKPTGEYVITEPIGLLDAYEYYMSYKSLGFDNHSDGYLNQNYEWMLMTSTTSSSHYKVSFNGDFSSDTIALISKAAIRPVINLKSNISFISGIGKKEEPYVIEGDIENAIPNITNLNTRMSGEYVKLESDESNSLFRIVDFEKINGNLSTKLVLNDYVRDYDDIDSDGDYNEILLKKFSSSKSYHNWKNINKTDITYWRGYLNNVWIKKIDKTFDETDEVSQILEKGKYYLGTYDGNYKSTICATISSDVSIKECIDNGNVVSSVSDNDYIGFLRVGELFSSQISSYRDDRVSAYWLINYNVSGFIMNIFKDAKLNSSSPSYQEYAARPTIHLKSTVVIKSGSGTEQDPFVVGLPS